MRVVLSSILGVLAAGITVFACELLGAVVFPAPPPTDGALDAWIARAPLAMLLWVVSGWFLGPLVGSALSAWVARTPATAYIVGSVLLSATLVTLASMPHPTWMWPAGVVAVVAGSTIGWMIAGKLPPIGGAT